LIYFFNKFSFYFIIFLNFDRPFRSQQQLNSSSTIGSGGTGGGTTTAGGGPGSAGLTPSPLSTSTTSPQISGARDRKKNLSALLKFLTNFAKSHALKFGFNF
jgi:hypothetical protein